MIGNPQYPTYQVFLAVAIAAIVVLVLMPYFIRLLRKDGIGQQVRADGPQSHLVKQGTPTMGGLMFIIGIGIFIILMVLLGFTWLTGGAHHRSLDKKSTSTSDTDH